MAQLYLQIFTTSISPLTSIISLKRLCQNWQKMSENESMNLLEQHIRFSSENRGFDTVSQRGGMNPRTKDVCNDEHKGRGKRQTNQSSHLSLKNIQGRFCPIPYKTLLEKGTKRSECFSLQFADQGRQLR